MTERLAVDIGGTFVDAITFDRETRTTQLEKSATTEHDPASGVFDAIGKVGAELPDAEAFIHGTTLGINAFLEREGAVTGIITNEGFRDVFEIGRTNVERDAMYDIRYRRPETLVPRRRRVGVPGRLDAEGTEIEPLDEDAVRRATAHLVEEQGAEAVAICFLHAYQNPEHERRAAAVVRETAPDVSVSISSDITREYREYERTSTTVLDAYIKPIFESYVEQLDDALAEGGFDGEFYITRSGGGTVDAARATTIPVHTILSGPAGGLIGTARVGEATGRDDLIAVDMGGTSLDACVIEDGTPAVEYESALDHFPMMIPVYDIRTIGAGGGSIAWFDRELLKVGPKSAGADPGPICYGQGGTEPTVTDAALALGYLAPDAFLGGEMPLDLDAALDGIEQRLADPLETSVTDASRGVFEVTLANTVGAIREITVEKGLDPREFTMVAYGGAGPMLVPLLGREMAVEEVMIPLAPSVFSAWGMLMADVVYDRSQTYLTVIDDVDLADVDERFARLEERVVETLAEEGFGPDERRLERAIEMRYYGQEHTVEVPADDVTTIDDLSDRFEAQHEARYGHAMDDPAQLVHLRLRGVGVTDKPEIGAGVQVDGEPQTGSREAYCFAAGDLVTFDVYDRTRLGPGDRIEGPAVVEEDTTTTVLHSDQHAEVDDFGHIIITEAP